MRLHVSRFLVLKLWTVSHFLIKCFYNCCKMQNPPSYPKNWKNLNYNHERCENKLIKQRMSQLSDKEISELMRANQLLILIHLLYCKLQNTLSFESDWHRTIIYYLISIKYWEKNQFLTEWVFIVHLKAKLSWRLYSSYSSGSQLGCREEVSRVPPNIEFTSFLNFLLLRVPQVVILAR